MLIKKIPHIEPKEIKHFLDKGVYFIKEGISELIIYLNIEEFVKFLKTHSVDSYFNQKSIKNLDSISISEDKKQILIKTEFFIDNITKTRLANGPLKNVLNILDKYFPFLLLAGALGFSIATNESIFLTSVTLSGVLCVVLAARGNIGTYPAGLYNCVGYAYIAYSNGLYGEMGLNLLFFLPTSVLGWFLWRNKLKNKVVLMRRISGYKRTILFAACVFLTWALGLGLSFIPTQNTPYIDALTNVLSIVATLLMMYRFQEQWFLYITLNVFTIIMWSIRMANGSTDGQMMIVMWSLYLINSFYGAIKWHIGANKNKKEALV